MDRDTVAVAGGDMTVEAVLGDVELATDEPLGIRELPVEHGLPRLLPGDEIGRLTRPERLEIGGGLRVQGTVGHVRARHELR